MVGDASKKLSEPGYNTFIRTTGLRTVVELPNIEPREMRVNERVRPGNSVLLGRCYERVAVRWASPASI